MAKLSAGQAAAFARNPARDALGVLYFGPDAALIALHRRDLVAAVTEGESMRLARLEPDQVRRDPAALEDALRARGFFEGGRRVVLVEGAKDGTAEAVAAAVEGLAADDAMLVMTGPGLTGTSKLVKLFANTPGLYAAGLYPDSAGTEDPAETLRAEGCRARLEPEAEETLRGLAAGLDAAAFRQFLATLALHSHGAERITEAEVSALAPSDGAGAAGLDTLVSAVAGGRPERVAPLLSRLEGAGTRAEAALAATARHFRRLVSLSNEPGGPKAGVDRLRPPVRGPARDRLLAEARNWPARRAEQALRLIHAAERDMRRSGQRPVRALAERCLVRLAMMAASARR